MEWKDCGMKELQLRSEADLRARVQGRRIMSWASTLHMYLLIPETK